jgi:hypothetical protein
VTEEYLRYGRQASGEGALVPGAHGGDVCQAYAIPNAVAVGRSVRHDRPDGLEDRGIGARVPGVAGDDVEVRQPGEGASELRLSVGEVLREVEHHAAQGGGAVLGDHAGRSEDQVGLVVVPFAQALPGLSVDPDDIGAEGAGAGDRLGRNVIDVAQLLVGPRQRLGGGRMVGDLTREAGVVPEYAQDGGRHESARRRPTSGCGQAWGGQLFGEPGECGDPQAGDPKSSSKHYSAASETSLPVLALSDGDESGNVAQNGCQRLAGD